MRHLHMPLILILILTLNTWFLHSSIIGILTFAIYAVIAAKHISDTHTHALAGPIVLLSSLIIGNTILYYLHGATSLTATIVLLGSLAFYAKKPIEPPAKKFASFFARLDSWKQLTLHPFKHTEDVARVLLVVFLDTSLLGFLWMKRTTELMPSPWQAVDAGFFIVFMLTTILLAYTVLKSTSKILPFFLVSLHLFTMYAVAPLLYPLGYGFDAFIHRATESWIFENGFINPKQPYYIGQYSLVVFLSKITGLSIFLIDVYLVPLLSAILIPFTLAHVYAKQFKMKTNHALVHILAIGLIPFLSFHLTTPHNLVVLLSLLTVFTTLLYQKNKLSWQVPFLLTLAALVTHPLIGAPIFGFFLTAVCIKIAKKTTIKRTWLVLTTLGQVFLLPVLFTINNVRTGNGWPLFGNPFSELPQFFDLFARPYWYLQHAPIFWEFIYAWERIVVPACVAIALGGFILYKKKSAAEYLYPLTALGIFLSAWLLRSWITFPDVVVYEQGDYPMRLIRASMLFLLPWFLYGLYRMAKALYVEHDTYWRTIFVILGAGLLTVSFYFSYPQRNIKSRFPGFNVTQSDFNAVELINGKSKKFELPAFLDKPPEELANASGVVVTPIMVEAEVKLNDDIDYIVLSNQLVSAAALTRYSFAKTYDTSLGELFYYSVPTGGPLYQQYGKMLYEGQKREYMEAAMDLAGVEKSYFVINSYWANSDQIIKGAKKTADSWWEVDDRAVWVFLYEK